MRLRQRREWTRNRIAAYGWGPVRRWLGGLAAIGLWCGVAAGVSWAALGWWSDQRAGGWVDWEAAWESFSAGESGRDLWLVASAAGLGLAAGIVLAAVPYVWASLRRTVRLRPWRPFVVAPRSSGRPAGRSRAVDVHLRAPREQRIIRLAGPEPLADAEPEAVQAAAAVTEPGSDAESEPVQATVPAGDPEPVADPVAAEPEPVADAEPEPIVDAEPVLAEPEPVAAEADGEAWVRPTSQPVLPLVPEPAVPPGMSKVLYVTRGIEDLSSEAIETLAWAYLQNRMVSPSEMAKLLDLKKPTVRRRCTRLAERGWLKKLGDNSYELSAAVRADFDLLAEACAAGDESGAVAFAEMVTARPFAQVNAEWLDAQRGGPSYREEITERVADALGAGIESFPDRRSVFQSAANRLYGD